MNDMKSYLKPSKQEAAMPFLTAAGLLVVVALAFMLLSGCASVGLTPEDKSKVVDAALEPGKTAWCLDVAVIEPMCIYKDKSKPE